MAEAMDHPVAPPRATTGGVVPILRVANLDASVTYYTARLGFEQQWRTGGMASVVRDRTSIMLCEGDQGRPGTWLWIAVSDVDVLYAELIDRGASLRHAPANYPWGSRECQIIDPDGHVLRFGADLKKGEPMGEWLDGRGRRWMSAPDGGWRDAGGFTANNELALHVPDPGAAEAFYTQVLGSCVFDRTPDCISLTNGVLRLYLLRDPERGHDAVVPSFDVPDRAAALAALQAAGCRLIPVGPHAPSDVYVLDPFGVVFDVIEREIRR
jgi:catechol 2,3-dioxygenase-like lactoylglutathione lyase family enzyme